MTSPVPLTLGPLEPFGVGGRRLCFVHPHDPGKCVKVLRSDAQRTVRSYQGIIPTRFRREYDNNAHELRVLTRLFRRLGQAAAECLPRCYGMVPTDLGPGLVLDLFRDHDGHISLNLRELISRGGDLVQLRPAYEALGAFLMRHRVVTRTLLDHNLNAQDGGGGRWRLYIIDGLGDPAWFPMTTFFPPLARSKIRRRVADLWPRLEALARDPVTPELIRQSTWSQGFLKHRG